MSANKSEGKGPKKWRPETGKEKKRMLSLLRRPSAPTGRQRYRQLSDAESSAFKQSLIDIIKTNQIELDPNRSTKELKNEQNESKTNDSNKSLKSDLQFGLNSIIRGIEQKSVIGLILTNPLALPLEDNIIELSANNDIPCLSVQSLAELKTTLNISSLSAIAFKPNVMSNDSIFHKFYEYFTEIVGKNSASIQSIEAKEEKISDKITEKPDKECVETKHSVESKSEDTVEKNLFNVLYTKKCEDNYSQLMSTLLNDKPKQTNDFLSQQSLIKISSLIDIHFPRIEEFSKSLPKIEVISDEKQTNVESNDNSFAQSLIDSSDESPNKSLKRKITHENIPSIDFKEPRIDRLESSTERIKDRKQRKQMKKQRKNAKNVKNQ